MTTFHKIYFEDYNQQMQKIQQELEKDSFLSTIQNISVVRGSAFKIEGQTKPTKMGKYEHSSSLPQTYFYHPDNFEYQMKNLKKDFE